MRGGTDSWLNKTAHAATLGIALLAGETSFAEPPIKQPDAPNSGAEVQPYAEQTETMRKATLARVIELMGPTRSENDEERLNALNMLEKELVPLGNTKLLTETRTKIIQELKINDLAKILTSQKGNEQKDVIDALMKLREHNDYCIRNRIERLMTQHFAGRPNEDPRFKPPDISRFTQHIDTIMVESVGELADAKSTELLRQEIRKTIDRWKLNNYPERELARKEMSELVRQTRGMVGIEDILREELTPKRKKDKTWADPKWNDLEVRRSAEIVLDRENRLSPTDTVYPPMQSTVGQVLKDMERFGGATVRFAESEMDAMAATPLFSPPRATHSQLLAQICELTGTYPVCDGHAHNLKLVPQGKEMRSIRALQGALLITEQTEDAKRTAHLLTDPQFAVVNAEAGHLNDGNASSTEIVFWECHMGTWTFQSTKSELTKLRIPSQANANAPENGLKVRAWVGSAPASCTLPVGEEKSFGQIGPQEVSVIREGDTVNCANTVYGSVPWTKTPCPSDMQTYGLSQVTRFQYRSVKGQSIEPKRGTVTVKEREIRWNDTNGEAAATVDVRGFQDLRQEEMTWDLETGKMTRKILKPYIDVSP